MHHGVEFQLINLCTSTCKCKQNGAMQKKKTNLLKSRLDFTYSTVAFSYIRSWLRVNTIFLIVPIRSTYYVECQWHNLVNIIYVTCSLVQYDGEFEMASSKPLRVCVYVWCANMCGSVNFLMISDDGGQTICDDNSTQIKKCFRTNIHSIIFAVDIVEVFKLILNIFLFV